MGSCVHSNEQYSFIKFGVYFDLLHDYQFLKEARIHEVIPLYVFAFLFYIYSCLIWSLRLTLHVILLFFLSYVLLFLPHILATD